jgi:hypothetical protein
MYLQRTRRFAAVSFVLLVSAVIITILYASRFREGYLAQRVPWFQHDDIADTQDRQDLERVSCVGPRGRPLSESPDDQLRPQLLDYGREEHKSNFRKIC